MHSALSAYSANWSEIYYNSYLSPKRRRCKKFVVSLQLCMFSKFNIKGTSRGFANIKSKRNMSTSTRNVLQYIYIGLISQNGHFPRKYQKVAVVFFSRWVNWLPSMCFQTQWTTAQHLLPTVYPHLLACGTISGSWRTPENVINIRMVLVDIPKKM